MIKCSVLLYLKSTRVALFAICLMRVLKLFHERDYTSNFYDVFYAVVWINAGDDGDHGDKNALPFVICGTATSQVNIVLETGHW